MIAVVTMMLTIITATTAYLPSGRNTTLLSEAGLAAVFDSVEETSVSLLSVFVSVVMTIPVRD
jgi:hypothetical protein